jgi:hypothetical protein
MCLVRDTGRPAPAGMPGRGQRLILSLVNDLGGSVEWSFAPDGARALVQLPLQEKERLIEITRVDAELVREAL